MRWLNDASRQFLERDYLLPGITTEQRVKQICDHAEKILGIAGFSNEFYENFSNGWYSFSTPIWINFGNSRGLPISCYGSYIEDTTESILDTVSEIGVMSKHGGGTSAYFGELRPRGSAIKDNGYSSGSVHFMQLFDSLITTINQGSARRGNLAVTLPIDHKDIEEFLRIKSEGNPIQHLSFSVSVKDSWMEEMINGDSKKRELWSKVLKSRKNTGYPYIFFHDNVNNNKPQVYMDKNLEIKSSNLCVAGNQRIPTQFGLLTAKELYEKNEKLFVFDNSLIVSASQMNLIERNVDTYKITLENGMTHTITEYHKVKCSIRKEDGYKEAKTKDIECRDLSVGDFVAVQTNKGIFGQKDMQKEAYLLGLYQGDGTQHNNTIMFDIWEKDFDLEKDIKDFHDYVCDKYNTQKADNNRNYTKPDFHECVVNFSNVRKRRLASNATKKALSFEKGNVPQWIWEGNEKTQWSYLKGILYTDGTVGVYTGKGNAIQLSITSINYKWLEQLQILMANLGIQTSIRYNKRKKRHLFPDGKGGKKYYETKKSWRIIVGNKNDCLEIEKHTGFLSRKNIKIENRNYRNNTKKYYKIKKIEYVGKQDVYCCKVDSKNHHFVCNGIITHNCHEIMLNSNEKESFVCCLSSMNILYYDEWKDTKAVKLMTYFLDAVIEDFINKASKIKHMDKAVRFAKNQRALGIGWFGWHSYLQSKMIAFESMRAKKLNTEIAKHIYKESQNASQELSKLYGEPELLKGYGLRNVTTCAIAPTKSSSFIIGQASEGIEPHYSNYYIKDLQKGKFTIKNEYLVKLLKSKNKDTEEVWDSILKKAGSVQHLTFLTKEEKDVFKTFSEISPMEIVIQASARQKYIDQGQSLNLMIHPSIPIKDVNALIIEAWKLGIKTLYYQISVNAAQEFSRSILSCSSCEG